MAVSSPEWSSTVRIPKTASYPTGSLEFLNEPHGGNRSAGDDRTALKLRIIIVGAGLGGLAAAVALVRKGHSVLVFEQAPELGEVGAGIQIPPNSSRILISLGLEPFIRDYVVEPANINFRRWQSGEVIGLTKLVPDFEERFSAPYWVTHRAHFLDAMYKLALSLGVDVQTASRVDHFEPEAGRVVLESGSVHDADLIIAADGIKSIARPLVLGGHDIGPRTVGFAAYRATVDAQTMLQDPETAWLIQKPNLNLWVGHMRHVMTYVISAGKAFNLVLSHPDNSDPSTWDRSNPLEDMKKHFTGWDPTLTKVLGMIKQTLKWPLLSGSKLPTWLHSSGKLILIGDSAHAMLPYMSQGAAIAVEDGAALAEALEYISSRTQLADALKLWEVVRMQRSSQMQDASLINGKLWHFADGLEQQARDAGMKLEVDGTPFERSPNQWSDPLTQHWCYNYDAVGVIRQVALAIGMERTAIYDQRPDSNGR